MIVDVWAQQVNDRFMQAPWLESLLRWTRGDRVTPTTDQLLAAMDAAGVDLALLSAWGTPEGMLIDNDEVAAVIARYPDRFRGVASVDLRDPMGAVREIRRSVEDLGFVAVRVIPWVWETPPDDARFYPVYVACVEAGVPFCTQIGHTGPLRSSEPGRPIPYLERVLLDFPELTVVAGHVGVPWIDEVLTLATKFPQFHVDTSAYALRRLPGELVEFMRGRGRRQVLFGTNWPMLAPKRCLEHLDGLGLDDEARRLFLVDNARRVFALDGSGPDD